MRGDSPIEMTGEAHLVSRTCKVCDESFEQPESTAEHQTENDIPPICSSCNQSIEDLWPDMYIRNQVGRLWKMAAYLEAYGYTVKAQSLRSLAEELELWESVIRAVNNVPVSNRPQFEEKIREYDESDH